MDWWRAMRSGGYLEELSSLEGASAVEVLEDCAKEGTGGRGVEDFTGVFSLLEFVDPWLEVWSSRFDIGDPRRGGGGGSGGSVGVGNSVRTICGKISPDT
jgi:hypothetical protein